jgi:quercetin dioxygenase-like cupin family protein
MQQHEKLQVKNFQTADEQRNLPATTIEVVTFGTQALMRTTFAPGWRWSKDVRPAVGTASCQVPHCTYGIAGRLHVQMDDGSEQEIGPGDIALIPPGHDAWVVGDEPYIGLDFQGGPLYGKPGG